MKSQGRGGQLIIRAIWHGGYHPRGDNMVATAPGIRSTFKGRRKVGKGFFCQLFLLYWEPETEFYLGSIHQNHDEWLSCDFKRSWESIFNGAY